MVDPLKGCRMKNRFAWVGWMAMPLALQYCDLADRGASAPSASGRGGSEHAFPGRPGVLKSGQLYGQPMEYLEVEGRAVVGGDIVLPLSELRSPASREALPSGPDAADGALGKEASVGRALGAARWINNIVYYRFDPAFTGAAKADAAIAHWEANTPLRFVQWTPLLSGHPDYLEFLSVEGDGCYSSGIGRAGGRQVINLDGGCGPGNAIHEIGHAVGLYHEQSRSDQAGFLAVDFTNVPESQRGRYYAFNNTIRYPAALDGTDFGAADFGSIMMDGSFDFALDPARPVMTKISDGSTWTGQRTALSAGDIAGVAAMYPDFWTTIAGLATDIGVGANGMAWHAGNVASTYGYNIYKRNGTGTGWAAVSGAAIRLDVDMNGNAWVVNNVGNLFQYAGSFVSRDKGMKFIDVGIGSDGGVFGVAQSAAPAAYQVYKWTGAAWTQIPGDAASRITVDNLGRPWIVTAASAIQRWNGTAWETLPGTATDIGAGPDGSVYIVETTAVTGGKAVSLWNGSGWRRVPGGAVAIDVGPGGSPWRLESGGVIKSGNLTPAGTVSVAPTAIPAPTGWQMETQAATDVGTGGTAANPTVWVTSNTNHPAGSKTIYRKTGLNGAWTLVAGAAVALDVDALGNAWVLNSAGQMCYWNNTAWVGREQGKKFNDIGVNGFNGANDVYGLVRTASADHQVHKWTGSAWTLIPGAAGVRITVDKNGRPWIVTSTGAIQRWTGSAWETVPGTARDIGAGIDGTVYAVGADTVLGGGTVSKWDGTAWIPAGIAGSAVDVDPLGRAWTANVFATLYTRLSDPVTPPDPPVDPPVEPPAEPVPAGWVGESGIQAIAVAAGGPSSNISAWLLSTTDHPAGSKTIYRKTGLNGAWTLIPGAAVIVDVDALGNAWVANAAGQVCYWTGAAWHGREQGKQFHDIAVNGTTDVFGLARTANAADYPVYKWNGIGWALFPGAAGVRITVDNSGRPWIVTSSHEIKRWTGTAWETMPGSAEDLDAGPAGGVHKLGTVNVTGGNTLWSWTGSAWSQLVEGAKVVDVDPAGNPWLVKSDGSVVRWNPGTAGSAPPLKAVPDPDPAAQSTVPPVPDVEPPLTPEQPPAPSAPEWPWLPLAGTGDVAAFSGSSVPNGYTLDRFNVSAGGYKTRWFANGQVMLLARRFVDIDMGRDCEAWAVTDTGTVFLNSDACNSGAAWQAAGSAPAKRFIRIAAAKGVNGGDPRVVYALTNEAAPGGFRLMKGIDDAPWTYVPGGFIDIDADDNGDLWAVNDQWRVAYLRGNDPLMNWMDMSNAGGRIGRGNTLAAGSGRALTLTGGMELLAWTSSGWQMIVPVMSGRFTSVQIAPGGKAWATDNLHRIWYADLMITPGPLPSAPGGNTPPF